MNRLIVATLLVQFVYLPACSAAVIASEKWERAAPDPGAFFSNELAPESYAKVDVREQGGARTLLSDKTVVAIEKGALQKYAPHLQVGLKERAYLVRAVECGTGGGYSVFRSGDSIYVYYGTLGSFALPRADNVALALVTSAPVKDVYSACGGAQ
jgi:hypothetical protein